MGCLCPHCGFNLRADQVIDRDGFTLDPRGAAIFDGRLLDLAPQQVFVLLAIASEAPRPIARIVVFERCSDTSNPRKLADLQMHNIRKRLARQGVPCPIESVGKTGLLRWKVPAKA